MPSTPPNIEKLSKNCQSSPVRDDIVIKIQQEFRLAIEKIVRAFYIQHRRDNARQNTFNTSLRLRLFEAVKTVECNDGVIHFLGIESSMP
jgi:hypothetical protein